MRTLTGKYPRLRAVGQPTVLIIEDDCEVLAALRGAFERDGVSVVSETSGARVVPVAERGDFDAVVVSRELPGLDGLDSVAYLRHRHPELPIVLLTAFGGPLLQRAAREHGATACVEKPVNVETLIAIVHRAMVVAAAGGATSSVAPPPAAPVREAPGGSGALWGVVLAGGQGRRLQPLVRHVHGDMRPKQYARLLGARTLLGATLDRVAGAIPRERTVIVSMRDQLRYLDEEFAGREAPALLLQPRDRGTAAAVLLGALEVYQRDPDATVALFPADHVIKGDARFMSHVRQVAAFVDRKPERIVVVGVQATEPETEYGWIEPGPAIGALPTGAVRGVIRFVEKPPAEQARRCMAAGGLWNTFVLVARAAALVEVGRQFCGALHERLAASVALPVAGWRTAALRRAYAESPAVNFSSAVLERCVSALAVSELTGVTWCDWGSPRRVVRSLRSEGASPPWLAGFSESRGRLVSAGA